jgi:hypothetical protein
VRKIISILVALGLVLAFSVVAMPTTGAACTATVTLDPATACEGASTTYNITFTSPVTLLPVNDMLSVEFGAGTTFGFTADGDVSVDGKAVAKADVVISGTKIEFPVPAAAGTLLPATSHYITVKKVKNPAVAGDYVLNLDYDLACCAGVTFDCAEYTIYPATSTYGFVWDSSPTYSGLALGFVPPFKVCGQEDFAGLNISGKWANNFSLMLMPTLVGCNAPCSADVAVNLTLTAAPAGSNVTLSFNGTVYNLVPTTLVPHPTIAVGDFALGANTTLVWANAIHFDSVGDYQICVQAFCPPGSPSCTTGCNPEGYVVASKCFDISVYQFKTATKIPLARKWNLISLPLVPLEEDQPIADVLAALPNASTLVKAIYYFDQCSDTWSVWGNGQSSLTTLEDGVSYWVKVEYSHTNPLLAPGLSVGGLWVWGTPKPVPPNSPSAYPVCTGWNMVGLTGYGSMAPLVATTDTAYLWNWVTPPSIGAIYGWDATAQAWWSVIPFGNALPQLFNGEGYWISFAHDGMIYPP